jgi:type I restriction enzyme S subunit
MKLEWEEKSLGDVCDFVGRGVSPKYIHSKGLCVLNQKCVRGHRVDYSLARLHDHKEKRVGEEKMVRVGDVLVNSTGTGTLGRVAQVLVAPPSQTTVDGHVSIVRPQAGLFYEPFFGYAMIAIEDQIAVMGEGCGGQTELSRTTLRDKFNIRYPKSISEQKRIVSVLDKTFAAVAAAKKNAEHNLIEIRSLYRSALLSIFLRGDSGWIEKPLSEICTIKHGFPFKSQFFRNQGKFVLLTPGNFFEAGGYRDRGPKQKYYVGQIPTGFMLKKGDLLVAMTEQAAGLLGSPVLVPEGDKFLHNQRLGLVVAKDSRSIRNEFLYHIFNVPEVRDAIHRSASGVKVRHTSPQKIGEVVVRFPTSIATQTSIALKLSCLSNAMAKWESVYEKKLGLLDGLKKAILQKAFAGGLRGARS